MKTCRQQTEVSSDKIEGVYKNKEGEREREREEEVKEIKVS